MLEYFLYGLIGWLLTVGLTKIANRGNFIFSTKSKSGNTNFEIGYNKQKEPSRKSEDSNNE